MPIKIPSDMPAFDVLTNEGVMVMSPDQAARQDIRPLSEVVRGVTGGVKTRLRPF